MSSARVASRLFVTWWAYMMEYRAENLLWTLAGLMPFLMMGLWMEAAESGALTQTPVVLARYYIAVFVARQLTVVWVAWEVEKDVVEGRLSHRLLLPMDPVWTYLFQHFTERVARLPFMGLLVVVFFVAYPDALWWPGLGACLGFVGLILGAFATRFAIQYTISLLSFWTERATHLVNLTFLPYYFFSGLLAPLSLFPELVRDVAYWTPYPYLIYVPSAFLVGDPASLPVDVGQGVAVMTIWLGAMVLVNRVVWARGLRHYSAMGA